jgi:hypothetical protein
LLAAAITTLKPSGRLLELEELLLKLELELNELLELELEGLLLELRELLLELDDEGGTPDELLPEDCPLELLADGELLLELRPELYEDELE